MPSRITFALSARLARRALLAFVLTSLIAPDSAAQSEALFPDGGIPAGAAGSFLLGDVSADGLTDLLEIGPGFESTGVRLGQPDGTFGALHSYPSGSYQSLVADFTGDGVADVLTFEPFDTDVLSVLPGLGDGAFGQQITTPYSGIDLFNSLAAGDIDEDGDLDLAVVNGIPVSCKCIDIVEGLGNGTFVMPPSTLPDVGKYPSSPNLTDATGDGHLDFLALVTLSGKDSIAMAIGDGNGGFGTVTTTPMPFKTGSMIAVDMDLDGLADLVATGSAGLASLLGVFRGTGSSFILQSTQALITDPPDGFAWPSIPWRGDVDGDGVEDLLVFLSGSSNSQSGADFLKGAGGFSFGTPVFIDTDMDSMFVGRQFVADLNADAHADLVNDPLDNLQVTYGRGDGTFDVPGRVDVGVTTQDLASGDFNLDGTSDLVAATDEAGAAVIPLFGAGDGSFDALPASPANSAGELLVADVTGDGLPDALTWSPDAGSSLDLLPGDGHGAFGPATSLLTGAIHDVDVADLNLDGLLDIAASRPDLTAVQVALSAGAGFAAPVPVTAGEDPGGLLLADLTSDGQPDLAVTSAIVKSILVLDGFGGAAFGLPQQLEAYDGPQDITASDLDGDGDLDLATTCSHAEPASFGYWVYIANVVHTQITPGVFSPPDILYPPTFTLSDEILAADLDRDGWPELVTCAAEGQVDELLKSSEFDFLHGGPLGLGEQIQMRTDSPPSGIACADFDGDGFPDLAASQLGADSVRIYLNRSPTWATLGHAGSSGAEVPLLTGAGDPIPDELVTVTGSLMPPPAPGLLFIGLAAEFAPYQGGVLVPSPDVAVPVRADFSFSQRWPKGIPPGTPVYLQSWFQSLVTGEVSASNALVTIAQ